MSLKSSHVWTKLIISLSLSLHHTTVLNVHKILGITPPFKELWVGNLEMILGSLFLLYTQHTLVTKLNEPTSLISHETFPFSCLNSRFSSFLCWTFMIVFKMNTHLHSNPPTIHPCYWKKNNPAGFWWVTPIILATQDTESRRISVQSQPRQIVRDPISKIPNTKQSWRSWWSGRVPA
jgi:hypothetical protein